MLLAVALLATLVLLQATLIAAKDVRIAELRADLDVLQTLVAWEADALEELL